MSYDTVIIGAGLSGLAAGIRLAYFDKKVCIVEKHYTIGGLNSFYRLRKRDHDVGLHAVTNYAEPGTKTGPLSKLLRQLRLRWDDFGLCPQIESSIAFPGRTLSFTNDFGFFRQQVNDLFPAQKDNFQKLLNLIDEHDDLDRRLDEVNRCIGLLARYAPRALHDLRGRIVARLQPDQDFPEFNEAFAEDWKVPLEGISERMVRNALTIGATQHISNCGWQPLLDGGLEALEIFSSTDQLAENFTRLFGAAP